MARHRSVNLVVVASLALLGAGTTVAWAGGIVGGHRADHIGTFVPISPRISPAEVTLTSRAAPTTSNEPTTTETQPRTRSTSDDTRPGRDDD